MYVAPSIILETFPTKLIEKLLVSNSHDCLKEYKSGIYLLFKSFNLLILLLSISCAVKSISNFGIVAWYS